jgi:carboxymethylenebutenolidase
MRRRVFAAVVFGLLSNLAVAQDWAKAQLEKSPRHHEWVQVKHGERVVHAFVAYPEVKDKRPVVIVIHENRGLTDWVRSLTDQVAAAGYIAIAPDLLSGAGPNGGKTSDFPDGDAAREAISKLDPNTVTADLNAVAGYARKLPAANGKVAVGGFCWGGAQTFRYAASGADIAAAFVFYGTGPEDVSQVRAPVYGFYGSDDARVNATIPKSEAVMKAAGKTYEPVIYEGAGHGFMRAGEAPDATEPNKKAREQAWHRWKELLAKL